MSHEIRTPMNGVLVMAELLAAGDLPPRARRNAEVIARSGQNLLAIINDILDFSKIEAGKLDVEHLPVDPVEACEDILRLFAERAQAKGIELAGPLCLPRGVLVDADPVRLTQVLSNLVNNALKFTENGSVFVNIEPDETGAGRILFSVSDTGVGIAADKIASIFQAFSQADQSTTRRFGGTGLGLSIASRLVTAMGGDLRARSREGEGSTFFFSLPLHAESRPQLSLPASTARYAILCVAGQRTRLELESALRLAGFRVTIVESTDDLQSAAHANLVIADLARLPRNARAAAARDGAIIALTSLGDGADGPLAAGHIDLTMALPVAASVLQPALDAVRAGQSVRDIGASAITTTAHTQFPAARVLVVDDSAVNREVALEALKRFGIHAEVAADGQEAVALTRSASFDLILMDGSMPVMDGFTAAKVIRAREADAGGHSTPIVALTAHVVGSGADAWKDCGMNGVLHKPFTLARMAHCLAEYLGHASGEGATAAQTEPHSKPQTGIDLSVLDGLRQMANGNGAVVQRIVALFVDHAPKAMNDIAHAHTNGDVDALRRAAHALKSMSMNIGALAVGQAAAGIESKASDPNLSVQASEIGLLSALVEQSAAALVKAAA